MFYRGATRDLSNVWSIAPQFEVDPLGKSIRFHVPTFIDGDPAEGKSIYLLPNRGEGGGTDISGDVPVDSDYLDVAVPNPDFEISPAEVRASFTFLFGRFYRDFGSGPRRGAYHSPGLDMHLIDSFSCGLYTDPGIGSIDSSAVRLPDTSLSLFQEVLYEDGGGALAKAAAVASPLLALSPTQATGGFTRHGIAGTSLSPVIDRVSVSINVPEAVTERVEFTKARSTAIPLAERTLQRIQRTEEVFSGQDALKRESREYRVLATQVSSQAKTEARARTHRAFTDVFEKPVGSEGGASALVMDRDSITFKAGDIVWLDDKGQPSTKGGTFGGIAVADTKGQQMYIAHSGRVPVRVAGPVPVGALVMGAPGDKTGRAIGPVSIGRLAHGQSVSEYITGGLVLLDVSEPVPSCRFRVTFDYAQQRLYVGQGALGLINPAHTVLPIEPTLDGKLLADIPWWSISGVSVSTDYVVICRYSHGVVTMIFRPASVVPSLDSGEIEWIIAKVRFLLDGTKFVVQSLTQLWWSDITIVFDDDSPPYDDDIITVVKQADIGTSGHERPQVKVTEAVVGIIHTYTVQGNGADGSLIIKDCEGHDLLRLAWRDGLIVKDSATFPSGNADTVLRLRTCAEGLSSLPLV